MMHLNKVVRLQGKPDGFVVRDADQENLFKTPEKSVRLPPVGLPSDSLEVLAMHSHSRLRRNIWAVIVWAACLPAFFVSGHLLKTGHNPPVGVYIAIMGLIAAGVTFREKMRPVEKAGWILLLTVFVFAEITNLYAAEAEQVAKFSKVSLALDATQKGLDATAAGIDVTAGKLDIAAANSQLYFSHTTGQISNVGKTLSSLRKEGRRSAEQLAKLQLSDMSPTELAGQVRAIEKQMINYLQSYANADSQISIPYSDHLVGRGQFMTPKETEDWIAEEKKKRSDLQNAYEADALKLVALANRLRVEMLGRLVPSDRQPVDDGARTWFDNPRSDKRASFLWGLGENADYLENLVKRMLSEQL